MPGRPKVLLIHASLGSGHKRAAQALQEVLQERDIENELQDLLMFLPGPLPKLYPRCYSFMINDCRWLWKMLYELLDKPARPYAPGKSILQKWQFDSLHRYLIEKKFTHIVSTHFAASALLTDWWHDLGHEGKIFSVVTDHVAHRCWKRKGLDHYFVPSDYVANQLEAIEIPREKITISGIPISRAFRNPVSREAARITWNCEEDDIVILMLCSGWNLSKTVRLLQEVSRVKGKLRFLISTGPESAKEEKVKKLFDSQKNFTIFGFSPQIAEMMSAADLIISKPGGLIVSEALAMGLPQLLLSPIPGQEEANARYSEGHGAAICVPDQRGALFEHLSTLITDRDKFCAMTKAAGATGKPMAAVTIVDQALAM